MLSKFFVGRLMGVLLVVLVASLATNVNAADTNRSADNALPPIINAHNPAQRTTTLADLPQAAQSLVSTVLGRDETAYHFQATAGGYKVTASAGTWQADFSKTGLQLHSGDAHWSLALQSIGYGQARQAVQAVVPTAAANRLEYARTDFTEWYLNGPAGLEQGWTVNTPPASVNDHILTLVLALKGNTRLAASGQSIDLLRADGTPALRYTGLYALDATGRELRTWLELDNQQSASIQIHVDAMGAHYPLTIDPYVLQAILTNGSGAANDQLGTWVAMSADGSTIAAGAIGVNGSRGAVYVFVRSGSGWTTTLTPTAVLGNSLGAANDQLGGTLSLSSDGSIIAAGATGFNSARGAVYVYVRPGGGWAGSIVTPTARLTNSTGAASDTLGNGLSISPDGSTIVAGAPNVKVGSHALQGAAYVFTRPGGGWTGSIITPSATITNPAGAANDNFGFSVDTDLNSSTIVVGALGVKNSTGAAYVFAKPGGGWTGNSLTPSATLTNPLGVANDFMGVFVAISADGSTIAATAYGVNSYAGAAYVFVKPGSNWVTPPQPNAVLSNSSGSANDSLGSAVDINSDGSIIALGAQGVSSNRGAVYLYAKSGSNWQSASAPAAILTNPGGAANDNLGWWVVMSGDGSTIVASAPYVSSSRGAAYVFFQTNISLSNLVSSSGPLNPAFTPDQTSYSSAVGVTVTSAIITPTASNVSETLKIRINGGAYNSIASGAHSNPLPLNIGSNPINILVTGADHISTQLYTLAVTRAPEQLSNLVSSSGPLVPVFTPGQTDYTSEVPEMVTSVIITPTASDISATLQVRMNGGAYTTITSGMPSNPLPLNVGLNPINVLVTRPDLTSTQLYTLTVFRDPDYLINLVSSSGPLNPAFDLYQTDYSAEVPETVTSVIITPTASDISETLQIRINGGAYSSMASGVHSNPLPLNIGSNPINVLVTGADHISTQLYTLTVTRAPDQLSNLVSSSGPLIPTFTPNHTSYAATVPVTVTSVIITPTASTVSQTLQIRINGGAYSGIASGGHSTPLPLNVGSNPINVLVTGADHIATNLYTLTVTRATDKLSNLVSSSGPLNPPFTPDQTSYAAAVPLTLTSVIITPTAMDISETLQIRINGGAYSSIASGAHSNPFPINVGLNPINVLVTRQDITSTQLYTLTVVRGPIDHIVVNTLSSATGDCSLAGGGTCSLYDAVNYANAQTGPFNITFSVSGTIPLGLIGGVTNIEISRTSPITIDASGANITLDGGNQDVTYLFVDSGATVNIKALTFARIHCVITGVGNNGTLNVTDSTFYSNTNSLHNFYSGTLTVSNSAFFGNSGILSGRGGGIYNSSGTVSVLNSTFFSNTGDSITSLDDGEGPSSLNVLNSTFANNNRSGIYNNSSVLTMTNSTLSGNRIGISNYGIGKATLRNTIIANSNPSFGNCVNSASLTADSFNLADDNTCDSATVKTDAQIDLKPLANNGGDTQTMALGLDSAAIDAGDNTVCPATDQRGVKRPQGSRCDVGAFEIVKAFLPLIEK